MYTLKVMGATILEYVPYEEFLEGSVSLWEFLGTREREFCCIFLFLLKTILSIIAPSKNR